jgi:DedD protein
VNDEGFREIQLNGKQLVFLFMAATVVSVVIFLCGVLVGRGVRPERASGSEVASAEIAADPGPSTASPEIAPPSAPPTATDGAKPADHLSYPERLQRDTPQPETLKAAPTVQEPVATVTPPPPPPARSATPPADVRPRPPPERAPSPAPPAQKTPPPAPAAAVPPVRDAFPPATVAPTGSGFAVQVQIFDNRKEADALAKELNGKGYPAFVLDPIKGAPKLIYRVRVGKYRTRKDAEAVSARLERAEKFTPWIAR